MADVGSVGRLAMVQLSNVSGIPPAAVVGIPVLTGVLAIAPATGLFINTTRGDFSTATPKFAVAGTVQVLGVAVVGYVVRAFRRDNGVLLGEAVSGAGGAFSIPIYGDDPEVTVIAYDNTGVSPDYNAIVKDRVVPL